ILPANPDAPAPAATPAAEGNAAEAPTPIPTPVGTEVVPFAADEAPCRPLTLADAVALAFQYQPRLRASLESIQQARGREDIAFATFLPVLTSGYSDGGFDLNAGGLSVLVGSPSAFTFIPALGAVPIGLNINTGYELAELKLQWLLCDFGRRLGRYNQAGLAADIAP